MEVKKEMINMMSIITNNPISKLNDSCGSKIFERIQSIFNEEEQNMYIANMYYYLTCNDTDFVVEFSNIWEWLGYSRIDNCKKVLVNNFIQNVDYIIKLPTVNEINNNESRKKECILLTVECFKRLCLKSRTDKADKIHEYYIKLEKIITNLIIEQSEELYKQLLEKDNKISELEDEKKFDLTTYERNLIENLNDITLIYISLIGNNLVKFGLSRRIEQRITAHKREIGPNFTLKYVVITNNFIQLEELIKDECKNEESVLYGRRISKIYNG